MSYETKIQKGQEIVDQFNESAETKVVWSDFLKQLKSAGGTTDETLSECSWEDLKTMGLPPLLAKQIAKVFRQSDKAENRPISPNKVAMMSIRELVTAYSPSESDSAVAERLKTISKGKHFIVFDDSGVIDPVSVDLLQELKDGYTERESYLLNGLPRQVYAVGDRPDNLADINPLYPTRILRPDGTCDQTNRSWQGVPNEVRWLVLLGVKNTQEIKVSYETAQNIVDIVVSEDAEKKISQRYTKARILFDRLKKENNLPALRVSMGGSMHLERPNDPFYSSREF